MEDHGRLLLTKSSLVLATRAWRISCFCGFRLANIRTTVTSLSRDHENAPRRFALVAVSYSGGLIGTLTKFNWNVNCGWTDMNQSSTDYTSEHVYFALSSCINKPLFQPIHWHVTAALWGLHNSHCTSYITWTQKFPLLLILQSSTISPGVSLV